MANKVKHRKLPAKQREAEGCAREWKAWKHFFSLQPEGGGQVDAGDAR